MWLLNIIGGYYVWRTLTKYRTPKGFGIDWVEPMAMNWHTAPNNTYGGVQWSRHMGDLEYHPDDTMRTSVTPNIPISEPNHVPISNKEVQQAKSLYA